MMMPLQKLPEQSEEVHIESRLSSGPRKSTGDAGRRHRSSSSRLRFVQIFCHCLSPVTLSRGEDEDAAETSSLSSSQRPTRLRGKASVVHPHSTSRHENTSATQYEEVDEKEEVVERSAPLVPTLRLYRSRRTFSEELEFLAKSPWYWGPISRGEAREKLEGTPDDSFLVRDSCSSHHLLSLSYRVDGHTYHTRIAHCNGLYSLCLFNCSSNDLFPSVVDMIEYAKTVSESGGVLCYFRPATDHVALPVRLRLPLSRFDHLHSLQALCRFKIRQTVRWEFISELPLPSALARFLEDRH